MPISPDDPDYMEQLLASLFAPPSGPPPLVDPPTEIQPPLPDAGQLQALPAGMNPLHLFNGGGFNVNQAAFPPAGNPVGQEPFVAADMPLLRPPRPAAASRPNIPPQFQGRLMPGAGNPGPMMNGMPGISSMFQGMSQPFGNIFGGQQGGTTSAPPTQGNIYGGSASAAPLSQTTQQQGVGLKTKPLNVRDGDVQRSNGAQILGRPRR